MPDAAQYTFGLFDSSALGWTVPTPTVTPTVSADTEAEDEPHTPAALTPQERGVNFALAGDRQLARGWPARARDNIAAIRLSKELEDAGRAPTAAEQGRLLRFIGFGATDMAQNAFPLPGETGLRPGWDEIGQDLADATTAPEYAALQRSTQYAHYTPEPVIRAIWRAAQNLGFSAGRILEPGMGTGLFFALMPEALRASTRLTGVEYDPITARIAALVHPQARVRREDYTRSPLGGGFDLAIGNPPFADRVIKADPLTAKLGLRLHERPEGLDVHHCPLAVLRRACGGVQLAQDGGRVVVEADQMNTAGRDVGQGHLERTKVVQLPAHVNPHVAGPVMGSQRIQQGAPRGRATQAGLPGQRHGMERGGDPVREQLRLGIGQGHTRVERDAGPGLHLPLERVAVQVDDPRQHPQAACVDRQPGASVPRCNDAIFERQRAFRQATLQEDFAPLDPQRHRSASAHRPCLPATARRLRIGGDPA